jgi:hypothetical protein
LGGRLRDLCRLRTDRRHAKPGQPKISLIGMRALTPGRLLYLLYYYPRAEMRRTVRAGGPWQQWLDWRGRCEMEKAAALLPSLPEFAGPPLELHQLTGHRFAFQSAFCLWTFGHAAQRQLAPFFYDDGTLRPGDVATLHALFPQSRVISHAETACRVEAHLPIHHFPALRDRFAKYPLLQKLINPHLGLSGWKLVLDADLLFFRRPDFILDWLADPKLPLYLPDVADAYGYSPKLLEKLAGNSLPRRVNVGLCGLRSDLLDWEKLEWWCAHLLSAEGSHYFLEQALVALILAGRPCSVAPENDYVTLPSGNEILSPTAVMHHYVDDSKRGYFRAGWRKAYSLVKCE